MLTTINILQNKTITQSGTKIEIGSVVKLFLVSEPCWLRIRPSLKTVPNFGIGSKSCPLRSGQISIFVEDGKQPIPIKPTLESHVSKL